MKEFAPIKFMPGYEISRSGVVRRTSTQKIVKPRQHPSNPRIMYVQVRVPNGLKKTRSSQINVLLEEAFGSGAAAAAGLPTPDPKRITQSRNRERFSQSIESAPRHTRTCATCGKPTNNYRCGSCWAAVRGAEA